MTPHLDVTPHLETLGMLFFLAIGFIAGVVITLLLAGQYEAPLEDRHHIVHEPPPRGILVFPPEPGERRGLTARNNN